MRSGHCAMMGFRSSIHLQGRSPLIETPGHKAWGFLLLILYQFNRVAHRQLLAIDRLPQVLRRVDAMVPVVGPQPLATGGEVT